VSSSENLCSPGIKRLNEALRRYILAKCRVGISFKSWKEQKLQGNALGEDEELWGSEVKIKKLIVLPKNALRML
jgi:hypothetical protein